jgi:hypothetical protein
MLPPMRNAIVSLVRSACLVGGLSLALSCGGSSKTALGKYNEECMMTTDCEQGLTCVNKVCTLSCMADAQCQSRDPKSRCYGTVCATGCTDVRDCPNGLACVMHAVNGSTCGVP